MENLEWRFRARVVACFGLVLSIISVIYVVFLTIAAVVAVYYYFNYAAIWGGLLYVVLMDILAGVQLWASMKLLSATEKGKAADEALEKSRIWLNVNAVLLGISAVISVVFIYIAKGTEQTVILIISNILGFGICFILMFIVYKFIEELEIIVKSGGSDSAANNLDCVYVK